jgi:hypothetical protein
MLSLTDYSFNATSEVPTINELQASVEDEATFSLLEDWGAVGHEDIFHPALTSFGRCKNDHNRHHARLNCENERNGLLKAELCSPAAREANVPNDQANHGTPSSPVDSRPGPVCRESEPCHIGPNAKLPSSAFRCHTNSESTMPPVPSQDQPPQTKPLQHPVQSTVSVSLPSLLTNHTLEVNVTTFEFKLPFGHGARKVTKIEVNGVPVHVQDIPSRNGAVHVIDKLLHPFRTHSAELESTSPTEVYRREGDIWEDWEEWLPQWASQ